MLRKLFGSGEPVEDSAPTFGSRWDRVTYLLSEYSLWIGITVVGALIIHAREDARLPTPPEWLAEMAVPVVLLAIPLYFIWTNIAKRVIARIGIRVIEHNGPAEDDQAYLVPPKTWETRDTGTLDAYQPQGGDVYHVSEFEWMDDTGTLRIEGEWPEAAAPSDVYASQRKWDRVYTDLLEQLMKAKAIEATIEEVSVDIYDQSYSEHLELTEAGRLPEAVKPAEKMRELGDQIEDTLDIGAIGQEWSGDEGRIDDPDRGRVEPGEPAHGDTNPGGEVR